MKNNSEKEVEDDKVHALYNKTLPRYSLKSVTLDPVTGVLDESKARHLLSRCLFGYTKDQLESVKDMTVSEAVMLLLEDNELPAPPLGTNSNDLDTPVGETWVNSPHKGDYNSYRLVSLHAWWIGQILDKQLSVREKMVLFWHNHFVTEGAIVGRADFLYQYNNCLRKNALGNFQSLTKEITVSPAMLRYLNGSDNTEQAPNENYARELMELFTISKGPLIDDGNYTFYTEQDVVAAAKVLTGWKINYTDGTSYFQDTKHDTSSKIFSEAFNNVVINDQGADEYKALIDLILQQEETAKFIVRKIYRHFIYYVIDEEIEAHIITPLADIYRTNNYEIKPVLETLLNSQHFFDEKLRGCLIKNPIDFIAATIKHLNFPLPNKSDLEAMYDSWYYLFGQASNQEMRLGDPTDVAGWPAYYLSPQYHQLWINASTLPQKVNFTNYATSKSGIKRKGIYYKADLLVLAKTVSNSANINILVGELAARLFPVAITEAQIDYLKETVIPGLPDFEWSVEWTKYTSDPSNEEQSQAVEGKLRSLVQTMFRMAEYQLS